MLTNYMKIYPLTLLIVCAVVALSLLPFGRIEVAAQVPLADKWTHMVMYAAVSFVAGWEHHRRRRLRLASLVVVCLVLPTCLGGLLELAQAYLTTYRSGEWMDLAADAIGAAVASIVTFIVKKVE